MAVGRARLEGGRAAGHSMGAGQLGLAEAQPNPPCSAHSLVHALGPPGLIGGTGSSARRGRQLEKDVSGVRRYGARLRCVALR